MTTKNLETFLKIQNTKRENNTEYNNKQYPRGFTMNDKKIVDSRYSGRIPLLTRRILLLSFSILLLFLMFAKINNENKTYTTGFFTSLVLMFMTIPLFYEVKKVYYVIILYAIVIILLGTMGYGWGIFGVIINLNPLKPKKNSNEN